MSIPNLIDVLEKEAISVASILFSKEMFEEEHRIIDVKELANALLEAYYKNFTTDLTFYELYLIAQKCSWKE